MPIIASYIVPHPPLSVPEVGKGKEKEVTKTITALEEVAKEISDIQPDTIVFISPHAEAYTDYFPIADGEVGSGSFAKFGAPNVSFRVFYDRELVKEISIEAKENDIEAGTLVDNERNVDHGTLVPLYYINKYYRDYKTVRLGLSGFSLLEHYRYGQMLGKVFEKSEKKIVVIASGDLSHCLKIDGTYGFKPEGPRYDELMLQIIKTTNFANLLSMNSSLLSKARECGHRSITLLAGMFDRHTVESKVLSHEAPFGVGYLVASFKIKEFDASRAFYELYCTKEEYSVKEHIEKSDLYVQWARKSIEGYLKEKKIPSAEDTLPDNFINTQSGAFVTIYEHGALRGCLGSIKPMRKNLALEIAYNAISAAIHDPRFEPITEKDLPYIKIAVDVISNPIPILSISDLDVKTYGVVVENDERRGVVLPNLPGIETPEQQIEIARKKAGLDEEEEFTLYRFEVTRHN